MKDGAKAVGANGQVVRGVEIAEGEQITEEMPLKNSLQHPQEHHLHRQFLSRIPSHVGPPTIHPFQRQSPKCHLNYLSLDAFQPRSDDQSLFEESSSSSVHDIPLISLSAPSRNLDQNSAPLHSRTPAPSFTKRRCSSLPPTLRRLKYCCEQQLWRPKPSMPMISNESCSPLSTSPLTPPQTPLSKILCSESCQQQLDVRNTQDKQIQTEVLLLPDVPTVSKEDGLPSSMLDIMPTNLQRSPLTTETCLDKVFALLDCTVATQCAYSSASTHTGNAGQGLLAQGQLGSLVPESTSTTPSEISPMAQLMQEYSSAETGIMSVLSLGELTSDFIVDRGKDGTRGLRRYHLVKATLDNICIVVMAQQTFVQRAAALMVEGKPQFIVDPGDTLIPILQGTNSRPQLYVAWKALMARMRLGVKTWGKYVAEYQLQVGAHC